jgi:hypothetical protein
LNSGLFVAADTPAQAARDRQALLQRAADLGLAADLQLDVSTGRPGNTLALQAQSAQRWTPGFDTLGLSQRCDAARGEAAQAVEVETVLALAASPIPLEFPSLQEWESALRMRQDIVWAARRTTMDFHTARVDRPVAFWDYDENSGFILRPGADLVEALIHATQPAVSGRQYAFSCYRATEYILLLGLAQEARRCHPALYEALQQQWRTHAVASGRFHDCFLQEWGSNEAPLPATWYVPGDRVWFRNPDEPSSDASGYEGSWVIYLGQGQFANFWKPDRPYDLTRKCVEVYHWRDGTWTDAEGDLRMDESIVEQKVQSTLADPAATAAVLQRMQRYKDGRGIYADGGCMDTTRESPRWVGPQHCAVTLPDVAIPVGR